MNHSISTTHEELAALVQLVAGFHPSEGELRTLLATARMFAASSRAKGDSDPSVSVRAILEEARRAELNRVD